MSTRRRTAKKPQQCTFCGRDRDDVRLLIAGHHSPKSFICDVCILLAVHALADRLAP